MAQQQPEPGPRSSCAILSRVHDIETLSEPSHPPISSIPQTSPTRLSHPSAVPTPFPTTPIQSPLAPSSPQSILYLAYGSNLSAETFLGVRKIRPISQVNVSAPSLRLTFDLPGIAYREPCFANTAPRKIPKLPVPNPPDVPDVPNWPPHNPPQTSIIDDNGVAEEVYPGDPVWDKGLIGVVYEVTPEDYARILATEGGGASYADILVPCFPLPARMGVPEKPPYPELPKMFLAHTLFAPRLPAGNGDGGDEGGDGGDDDGCKMPTWMKRLLLPVARPEAEYAQPSARYLKLIRDGAREHELPDEYQAYLARLQPYTITTFRQRVGMVLFLLLWAMPFLVLILSGTWLADDQGRAPRWLVGPMNLVSNLAWLSHDVLFKPVFGDGERTMDGTDAWWRRRDGGIRLADEEMCR